MRTRSSDIHDGPQARRERLAALAAVYTEPVHDRPTRAQLGAGEPVSHFAAVTSEGSAESSYAGNGNLIVSDTTGALAEQLRQHCGEGWFAHGRVWDLDLPWHLWGNLEASYSVQIAEECVRPVPMVAVAGREGGIHLFEELVDAEAFGKAVRRHGGHASITEAPLHDRRAADRHRCRSRAPSTGRPGGRALPILARLRRASGRASPATGVGTDKEVSMIDQTGRRPKPDSPPDGSRIWVCALVTVDGIETWACQTERLALRELANACRRYWEDARYVERRLDRDPDLPRLPSDPPADDGVAVERYFDVMEKALPPECFLIAPRALVDEAAEEVVR